MGRPAKEPKEKLMEVPCKVSVEVAEEIARMAENLDRSRSQIARKLISRGLAAYMRDGKLDEPLTKSPIAKRIPTPEEEPIPTEPIKIPAKPPNQIFKMPHRKGGK